MTRKRFIKLLMSHGEQIHRAQAIAFLYNSRGIPYREAYADYYVKTSLTLALRSVSNSIVSVSNSFREMVSAFNEFAKAVRGDG